MFNSITLVKIMLYRYSPLIYFNFWYKFLINENDIPIISVSLYIQNCIIKYKY